MTKAETMLEALIGSNLAGIEIDEEDGFIRLNFPQGFIEIDGDDLALYVELDEVN